MLNSNYAGATRLMEATAEQLWLNGEASALSRWIMTLPDEVVRVSQSGNRFALIKVKQSLALASQQAELLRLVQQKTALLLACPPIIFLF